MAVSFCERKNDIPVEMQIRLVTRIANSPERKTVGSISVDFPWRKASVNNANPIADPKAARIPPKEEEPNLSDTIMKTPTKAAAIADQVVKPIFSPKKNLPSNAAKNGAVAKSNSALATEIFWME